MFLQNKKKPHVTPVAQQDWFLEPQLVAGAGVGAVVLKPFTHLLFIHDKNMLHVTPVVQQDWFSRPQLVAGAGVGAGVLKPFTHLLFIHDKKMLHVMPLAQQDWFSRPQFCLVLSFEEKIPVELNRIRAMNKQMLDTLDIFIKNIIFE